MNWDGEVMLCLNTAEGLRATIEKYHATDTPEEIDRHIKWNPGDWIYANINADETYTEAWDAAWWNNSERGFGDIDKHGLIGASPLVHARAAGLVGIVVLASGGFLSDFWYSGQASCQGCLALC